MDIEIAKSQARNWASQREGDPSAKSSLSERGVAGGLARMAYVSVGLKR